MPSLDRSVRILIVTGLVAVFAAGAIWVTPKKGEPGPIGLELAGNREALGRALAGTGPSFGNGDHGAAREKPAMRPRPFEPPWSRPFRPMPRVGERPPWPPMFG